LQPTTLAAGLVIGQVLGASLVVAIIALPSVVPRMTVTETSTAISTTTQTSTTSQTSTTTQVSTKTLTSTTAETSTLTATTIVVTTPPTVTATTTTTTTEFTTGSGIANLTLAGSISVPGGSGQGVLVLDVKDTASLQVALIAVNSVTPSIMLTGNNGPGVTFFYNQMSISMSNPLPVGATTSTTASTTGAVAGQTYAITLYVVFTDNSALYLTINIAAQV
jgi:hypothetical protein